MEMIAVGGAALEVERIGASLSAKRAPIVFLHEGLGSIAMWRDWPSQVCEATGRAGIAYSRRGYGNSEGVSDVRGAGRLPADYLHREAWDVLPELLCTLGIQAPVLVGHSDGGSIALLHASRHPVTACVVVSPHVIVEQVSLRSIEAARDAYDPALKERLRRYHSDVDAAFWQWNDVWLSDAFRSFDIRPDCRRLTAPLLAIQGRDDAYGTMRQVEEIAPTQGPFSVEMIAHCGHSAHKDQPDLTRDLVASFLAPLP